MASVAGSLSVVILPVFLVGALSDRIGRDLGFGSGGTGVMLAVFFLVAGAGALPAAGVTARIGARRAIRAGLLISAAAAASIGSWVGSAWQLALVMAVAGSVVGLVDTGGARIIGDLVPVDRHGMAFGLKEASIPAASMLAGASIPAIADRLSWRVVFAVGIIVSPLLWWLLPDGDAAPRRDRVASGSAGGRPSLVAFAVGIALAVGAATAAATFLVPATEELTAISTASAGIVLAAASIASIGARVVLGVQSDRRPDRAATIMVGAIVLGASGAVLLSVADRAGTAAIAAVLVLGAGWGWTGLAFLLAVRARPDEPPAAAGVVLVGLSIGGVGGPAVYGAIASWLGYRQAWLAVAIAMLAGGALIRRWSHRLRRPPAGAS